MSEKDITEYSNRHTIEKNPYWDYFSDWLGECDRISHIIEAREYPEPLQAALYSAAIRPYVYYREDRLKAEGVETSSPHIHGSEPATEKQLALIKKHLFGSVRDAVKEKYGAIDIDSLTRDEASAIIETITETEGWKK